ncbi:gliding motility-associated C-terminal domain-containing protein [Myroides odoratimimus]|uniref:Gliding motility-associated C-terminal domain-containing protein n=1 Tax=Myroides odoratimimus CIP 101113 TaxID=883154 RepID=A0AAV3F2A7_9FLAO|nr:T9SS C-terminal target domain-containing protein [Myroides odoratimimus]EHO09904.1 hypothetical protein HMPREF9715_02269 [Myroides odoratimimus CIP 101113]
MKKKVIQSCFLIVGGVSLYGQEVANIIVNEGELVIPSKDIVSFESSFENKKQADMINDGHVVYYKNFINQGNYGFTPNMSTSKTIFINEDDNVKTKQILGQGLTLVYDLEFDSSVKEIAFDLKNNIDVYGTADFKNGIVKVDSVVDPSTNLSKGMLSFQQGAKAINLSDSSHVQGLVEKIGNEPFQYPIGDKQTYRYARISAGENKNDVFVGEYRQDESFFKSRSTKSDVIKELNTKEYWFIDKGKNTKSDILLTLSWDDRITSSSLLKDPENELHIVRWDAKNQLWVDEGGVVDMLNKEVTTVSSVKGYGFFTLGTVKKEKKLEGGVVIYNLVTPNGDGKNDYFIIDNIHKYPNNTVEIYNRWGVRVFKIRGYDPNADGSSNVFNGYSNGDINIEKNKKLPSGTYYYVVSYEYTDSNGTRLIKKAANLHLETN